MDPKRRLTCCVGKVKRGSPQLPLFVDFYKSGSHAVAQTGPQTHYTAQAGQELVENPLLQPLKGWDDRPLGQVLFCFLPSCTPLLLYSFQTEPFCSRTQSRQGSPSTLLPHSQTSLTLEFLRKNSVLEFQVRGLYTTIFLHPPPPSRRRAPLMELLL